MLVAIEVTQARHETLALFSRLKKKIDEVHIITFFP